MFDINLSDVDPVEIAGSICINLEDGKWNTWNLFIPTAFLEGANTKAYLYNRDKRAMALINDYKSGLDEINDFLLDNDIQNVEFDEQNKSIEELLQFMVVDRIFGTYCDDPATIKELTSLKNKVEELFPDWDLKKIIKEYFDKDGLECIKGLWGQEIIAKGKEIGKSNDSQSKG